MLITGFNHRLFCFKDSANEKSAPPSDASDASDSECDLEALRAQERFIFSQHFIPHSTHYNSNKNFKL